MLTIAPPRRTATYAATTADTRLGQPGPRSCLCDRLGEWPVATSPRDRSALTQWPLHTRRLGRRLRSVGASPIIVFTGGSPASLTAVTPARPAPRTPQPEGL